MAVFREDRASTGTQEPTKGIDCRSAGNQTPQSALRLPSHCLTDLTCIRSGNRKDVVRRILASHPLPKSGGTGPSWLCAIAEVRDSLWSVDLLDRKSVV